MFLEQLVPAAMPDYSQERVITLVGTKQQTDLANDLIREVIDEVGVYVVCA